MTTQEAIKILDWIPTKGDEVDAMEMAIEALQRGLENVNADSCSEKPNRSDVVYRQDVIGMIQGVPISSGTAKAMLIFRAKELPSVQPETNCSEFPNNSDTISRQAAIDAVKTYWKKVVDDIPKGVGFEELTQLCDMALEHNANILKAIDQLPSVQPEIIRCKDCKFGEQDEVGRWFCRGIGCQIGNEDGSGFCADAERRTDE